MKMTVHELADDRVRVELDGRLDTVGAGEIEMPLTLATVTRARHTIVDLHRVELLSSMGIRLLVSTAKALKSKQRKLVLLSPQVPVETALHDTGIDKILPITHDAKAAASLLDG